MRALHAVILVFVCLEASSAQTPHDLNSRGVEFFRQGKYAESEKAYREAIAAYKAAPILDVNGYAATLNNLAGTLQTNGKVAEARRLLTEVISLDSQVKGEDDIVTHAMNNLALLHEAEGECPKAIALLQRALDRCPSPSVSKAGTLHNLGAAYIDMGQHKKAREILESSLQMHTQVGAVRETPPTLAFLGALAFRANDERQALNLLERALTLRREIYGAVHPLVALSIHDLGEIYRNTNRWEESAAMLDEALRILEASAGAIMPMPLPFSIITESCVGCRVVIRRRWSSISGQSASWRARLDRIIRDSQACTRAPRYRLQSCSVRMKRSRTRYMPILSSDPAYLMVVTR